MSQRIASILLIATSAFAAEFQSGQAARAVIGQSSFSSAEQGIAATSLVLSKNRLYASDATHHVFTFDLSQIPDLRDKFGERTGSECAVCGFAPLSVANQTVMAGVAAVATWGKTVAVADTPKHRVLIWRNASRPRLNGNPDVVLGDGDLNSLGPATLMSPISVALDGRRLYVGDAALHRILIWNSIPSADNQPADEVLGQNAFASDAAADALRADTFDTPAALASDGTNLFVADPAGRRILIFSAADGHLQQHSLLNSASLINSALAPGTLITIEANGLADAPVSAESEIPGPLPVTLGGTEVVFDGQPLPLLAVSPSQVQAQLPYDLSNRSAASLYVRTEHADGTVTVVSPVAVKIALASPGLFGFGSEEPREGIVLHSKLEIAQMGAPVTSQNPARPGDILTVWANGLGKTVDNGSSQLPASGVPYSGPAAPVANRVLAFINGQQADVLSAKLPSGAEGVYEIQILVPPESYGESSARLFVTESGYASNTVVFPLASQR